MHRHFGGCVYDTWVLGPSGTEQHEVRPGFYMGGLGWHRIRILARSLQEIGGGNHAQRQDIILNPLYLDPKGM